MYKNFLRILAFVIVAGMLFASVVGCGQAATKDTDSQKSSSEPAKSEEPAKKEEPTKKPIRIGLSMATLQEERWQRDRDIIVNKAKELGAEVLVQSANGDENLQNSQAENLITQGIDALIVIPQNGDAASPIIDVAHKSGVKVLAYDRLIKNCDLDFYLTFDCTVVGEIQAEYAISKAPKGNYILIGGSPTDNNAHLIRNGQMKILQPYIDKGDIKVVVDQWAKGWNPEEALMYVEDGLTANNNNIQCVLTSNDGCAGAAIQALSEQGLAGKVPVTGLDADLAACQRIVEGTQSMTVYRRFSKMDEMTAEVAVALAKGEKIPYEVKKVNNGKVDVPSILLTSKEDMFAVDANNMKVIIEDKWLKLEEIYKNIPKDKWPQ